MKTKKNDTIDKAKIEVADMENIPQMIWKEVWKVMETSGTIFEKVRLVDPVKSREIRITPEGTLKEDTSCFSYLNADVKCSNCSSIRAYHEGLLQR